ncbi:MFS transporter [Acholeplasma vituli]|uniref:MFS transporter n=1 Tax=Paracholeplasma vituli TaxID=69473 RepID=A0ABT2PW63_9MOLU|nr:MFS transporter [Paracholeplasma vituli]MCU0104958.1 MFS transporter [Paracholeplasma vituli]
MTKEPIVKKAFLFLLLLGFISLLSDFTHEGARSIYGPYLGLLGVSAFMVSFTSGLGEFVGQAFRLITGPIADKTKKYWLMMFIGYALNLLVIPLLMFVQPNIYVVAIILILLERVGKGIRAPAKSALTSFTTPHLGAGKSFAIQEAMDQFGAFLGPIFVFTVLNLNKGSELNGYQLAFGLLGIFAILTLLILVIARVKYPKPDAFEKQTEKKTIKGNKAFIYYMVGIALIGFGFIDYPVLAFHMSQVILIDVTWVPLLYALAMGVDAIAALFFGFLYDKKGLLSLILAISISLWSAPVFFLISNEIGLILGVILWGIGMGAQESILKAVISNLVSKDKRATAYGIFYTVFGVAWFLGSMVVGALYEVNILYIVLLSSFIEASAVILLIIFNKKYPTLKGGI